MNSYGDLKAWLLMCCGCGRIMDNDGRPSVLLMIGGAMRTDLQLNSTLVMSFDTKGEADTAASSHGWSTSEGNHRCPSCSIKLNDPPGRRGAYISTKDL